MQCSFEKTGEFLKKHYYERFTDPKLLERKENLKKIDEDTCNVESIIENQIVVKPCSDVLVSEEAYRDIEFWEGVFPHICKCSLKGGKNVMSTLFKSPSKDIVDLELRKKTLVELERALEDASDEVKLLNSLRVLEDATLWAFHDVEDNLQDLYNMVYFRSMLLKKLNNSPEVLTGYNLYRILLSPIVGLISPVVYFVIPYMVIVFKFKIKIGFFEYLRYVLKSMLQSDDLIFGSSGNYKIVRGISYVFSLIFYFQGVFNSFDISRTLYKITKHLTERVNKIGTFMQNATELVSKYWKDDMAKIFGIGKDVLKSLDEEIKYVREMTVKPYSFLMNFGKQLHTYKTLDKSILKSLLVKTYVLDCLTGLIKFKQEYKFAYAEYLEETKPVMKLRGLRHPSIDKEKCVENDIMIGGKNPNNIIITGTNAGGKSVFIKSLLVNTIMCQTCTVSCCDAAAVAPLGYISSQINVPDMTGHESLFEAEMHRCKKNLDYLKGLEQDAKSLIVMDEIFSSTNPLEAISGAYAVCKKMSECEGNLLIFTTHFNYLTKLRKTKKFVNYKLETLVDGEDIRFTYKLVPGVNKHYLALELLKKNGFDEDIIQDALEIKKRLSSA